MSVLTLVVVLILVTLSVSWIGLSKTIKRNIIDGRKVPFRNIKLKDWNTLPERVQWDISIVNKSDDWGVPFLMVRESFDSLATEAVKKYGNRSFETIWAYIQTEIHAEAEWLQPWQEETYTQVKFYEKEGDELVYKFTEFMNVECFTWEVDK